MKKSIAVLLISAILMVSLLPGAGLAYDANAGSPDASVTACAPGSNGIRNSLNMFVLEMMVDAANAKIDCLVKHAQLTPYDDVAHLLNQIEATVAPVFNYAEAIGATVACEYVGCWIDGQYALIDPIRVIRG